MGDTLNNEQVIENSLAVDASCIGNPGPMEYQAVHVASLQPIFHFGPIHGTNNIGEFLAIVHALALIQQKGWGDNMPVYSDSLTAIQWVKQKRCRTKLKRDEHTESLFQIINRAEDWLRTHTYTNPVLKWQTHLWGDIPADFARKI